MNHIQHTSYALGEVWLSEIDTATSHLSKEFNVASNKGCDCCLPPIYDKTGS